MGKAARPAGTLQGLEAHQHCGVTDVQGVLGVSAEPGTSSAQHLSLAQHLQPLTCQLCTGGVRTQSTTQVGNPDVSSLVPLSQCLGFLPKVRLPKQSSSDSAKVFKKRQKMLCVAKQDREGSSEMAVTKRNTESRKLQM